MADPETQAALDVLSTKIDAIYVSVEKTRKYLFWTFVITIALVVLPLIGLLFAAPAFLSSYTSTLQEVSAGQY
jgi:hypothetical protein